MMSKSISIENLTTTDKLELMEKLWVDLSSSPEYSPPEWHSAELAQRKNALQENEITYTDWNKAKEEIQNSVS